MQIDDSEVEILRHVKNELKQLCWRYKKHGITPKRLCMDVNAVIQKYEAESVPPCLLKRVEATVGRHLCGLWKGCRDGACQYDIHKLAFDDEVAVYRPFNDPVESGEKSSIQRLLSEAMESAQGASIVKLKQRLSDAERRIESMKDRKKKTAAKSRSDRIQSFESIVSHMSFCGEERSDKSSLPTDSSSSSSMRRVESRGLLCIPIGLKSDDSVRPKRKPAVSSLHLEPPVPMVRKTSNGSADWPYRDVFPQFLRKTSKKRTGDLTNIMSYMSSLKRPDSREDTMTEEKSAAIAPPSLASNWRGWIFALWLSPLSQRLRRGRAAKLFVTTVALIAMYALFALIRRRIFGVRTSGPRRSLVSSVGATSVASAKGLARLLPAQSIFARTYKNSSAPAPSKWTNANAHRQGLAHFLPKGSIFSRLYEKSSTA
eukprot:g2030.t1